MTRSIGRAIYSGSAELGRVSAIIGAVFATLIGIGLVVASIFMLTHKSKLTSETEGVVITSDCSGDGNGTCTVKASFMDHPTERFVTASVENNVSYRSGDRIAVYFDPSNPVDASFQSDSTNVAGWIFLAIGIFITIVAWLSVWLTQRSKIYAAATGVSTVAGALFN